MTSDFERRRSLLIEALATLHEPELALVHQWLDNWSGLGHLVVGMEGQGYALSLTKISADGWRATFHAHQQLSADGVATDEKPWRAVQLAAWNALVTPVAEQSGATSSEVAILP